MLRKDARQTREEVVRRTDSTGTLPNYLDLASARRAARSAEQGPGNNKELAREGSERMHAKLRKRLLRRQDSKGTLPNYLDPASARRAARSAEQGPSNKKELV